jgi:CPA2 family monovalent cation:H+ antiporter-2
MDSLALTLLVVFTGIVLVPPLARRIGLPVIVAEILFGMIIGDSLFGLVPEHDALEFCSSFGLVYLMFLGGLETDFARLSSRTIKRGAAVVLASISVPFLSGFLLAYWVGVNPLLLGTIFCTTSLGLALPLLKDIKSSKSLSRILLATVILVDIISLFLLAFVLNTIQGLLTANFVYSLAVIITLFLLPSLIRRRRLRRKLTTKLFKKSYFDTELRAAFALIFLLAAISSQLGFHSIIGAFIAGLIASEVLPTAFLREEKLQSFGYGFFIPLFFILTGAKVDLPSVFSTVGNIAILLGIVSVGLLSKVVSVTAVARLSGFKWRESATMGLFHSARLSLIIAAADISLRLELINPELFAMLVILAVVSATVAPVVGKRIVAAPPKQNTSRKVG